jgi:hypothetical protein
MGGMIGFTADAWTERTNTQSWTELLANANFDWKVKGSDQTFLNRTIYPMYATQGNSSIIQHFILGMPNTFLDGYSNPIPDIAYMEAYSGSNDTCGHIGAAGWYEAPMMRFLKQFKDRFTDILEVEKQYPEIFYWANDGTFD